MCILEAVLCQSHVFLAEYVDINALSKIINLMFVLISLCCYNVLSQLAIESVTNRTTYVRITESKLHLTFSPIFVVP